MRRYLHVLAYLLGAHLLILALMTLYRGVELGVLHGMMATDSGASVVTAFVKGVWFDNVVACYLMILPLVLLLIAATLGYCAKWLRRFAAIWLGIGYTLIVAVSAANIPYFAYFFKNLDASIFGWFGYAGTTAGMLLGETSYIVYFVLFAITLVIVWWGLRLWRRYTDRQVAAAPIQSGWKWLVPRLALTVVMIALCLFGIRGRMGYNPIKISQAYYCDDPFLNQLGISPSFNLITSTLDGLRKENAELHLMPYEEAVAYTRHALGITGVADSTAVLRRHVEADTVASHPNVVIILMESMSASLLQTFGQQQRLTPTLDSLYRCSLAFTRFYSAGIHTNHGLTATL